MQANTTNERELVEKCMQELCAKAGFTGPQGMVQRDLEFLCDSIENRTGVLISLSTIKRLLNGQFSRLPQIATLNAVCVFLEYQNWQDFKKVNRVESNGQLAISNGQTTIGNRQLAIGKPKSGENTAVHIRHSFPYKRALLLSGILLVVVVGLLAMFKMNGGKPSHFEKAKFAAVKTTSNDLPNSVVFNYNIDGVNADSFFIQQSWDRNRRVRIYKNNYALTDIYYEPGYHTAKLIANEEIIRTQDVSIPTDRWFFYSKEELTSSETKYIHPAQPVQNGSLQLTKDDILKSQVDITKNNHYIQVYFPTLIDKSSDNYHLRARVRTTPLNNTHCTSLMYEIFCQRNFMYFISMPKGCASEITGQFGETHLNGKSLDLSPLATDVQAWQEVDIIVKDKKVEILINGKPAFSTSYKESGGMITGLGFISNGIAEVDFVDLKTIDGKEIYTNQFN
jgi:hypothetical protein